MINSQLNDFMKRTDDIREAQASLTKKDHPFMPHDSWIDCSKVLRLFDTQEVAQQIIRKVGSLKGRLNNQSRTEVREIVKHSRRLDNRDKKAILLELRDLS